MTVAVDVHADEVLSAFRQLYSATPEIFRAPGRVNLIGDHTDYNDGFVMPMAIDRGVSVAIKARADRTVRAKSLNFNADAEFDLDALPAKGGHKWNDYVMGVASELERAGHRLRGCDMVIAGDIPLGAGLSSSAGVEIAVGAAFTHASGADVSHKELALICQRAENNFVGAQCGIMDQFISANGKAGHAMLLDCRSLEFRYEPLPRHVAVFVCNSMVKHSIAADGGYNSRRRECEAGVELLKVNLPKIKALRDVTLEEFSTLGKILPPQVMKRCRHVITENARVLAAAEALEHGDMATFGKLMNESHASLRDDYDVSVPEVDFLVELAQSAKGVYGARITGGGFGGCIVAMVERDAVSALREKIQKQFKSKYDVQPDTYECVATDGVHQVA